MNQTTAKLLFRLALIVQAIGLIVLLAFEFGGPASNVAIWVVIGAGIVEVALALRAKRKGETING